jgi:hypothetical protein
MNMKRLLFPLIIGSVFAALNVVFFHVPFQVPSQVGSLVAAFLIPGLILGLMAGSNVHDPRMWVAVLGNFLFYFRLVRIVGTLRERRRTKARRLTEAPKEENS